ncbi:hypothetical protein L7F22_024443 [Adiantum nelumboides]|nr:hypothetical protein [Adiantum nelumboides]
MAGGAVSWRSRLQTCVTQSTTEAEYVAASEACKKAIWLGRLMTDLGIKEETPMLYCDSQSAIQLARNPVYHSKTKHVDVKYHSIREMVEDKQVQLVKVHTTDNPADLLTKGLPRECFAHCRKLLGIGAICVQCLEKLPSYNSRQTYACNAYSFNYLVEHGFVFLLVANDSVGRELPFAFLERTIKEDFLEGDQTTNDVDIELELENKFDIAYRLDKEFGPN